MESLYLLIPISMAFVALAIGLYFWAVKGGQYDDLELEGKRILFEQEAKPRAPQQREDQA